MHSGDNFGGGAGLVGWAVRQAAIWGGVALALYFAVGHWGQMLPSLATTRTHPTQPAAGRRQPVPGNTLAYRANPQGHVLVEAVVNGEPVRFMVDTGATVVALSARDAIAVGLGSRDLDFSSRVQTASGTARAAPVTVREIRLGQLSVEDVPAIVVENLQVSLLGQSFLRRLQSYEMRDGVLTITW